MSRLSERAHWVANDVSHRLKCIKRTRLGIYNSITSVHSWNIYIHINIHTHTYIHAYTNTFLHAYTHTHTYITCAHTYAYIHNLRTYTRIHTCVCTHTYITCAHTHMNTSAQMHTRTHSHTHLHSKIKVNYFNSKKVLNQHSSENGWKQRNRQKVCGCK